MEFNLLELSIETADRVPLLNIIFGKNQRKLIFVPAVSVRDHSKVITWSAKCTEKWSLI